MMQNYQYVHNREKECYSQAILAFKVAYDLYRKVERKARWRRFVCCLLRRSFLLPDLASTLACGTSNNRASAGIQAVDLEQILGSENRSQDFDQAFYPLNEKNRERWMRIAKLCLTGQSLPAVDLIQVGQKYYVRDGHHRVSVMRALGYKYIDANVTVW